MAGTSAFRARLAARDVVDALTGDMFDDVLVFPVADSEMKAMWLASDGPFLTTHHFEGYAAVLARIEDLSEVSNDDLFELVSDAWLTRAPKCVVKAWLAEQIVVTGD